MSNIDDLITLCLLGEASLQEQEELNLWIAQSAENKKYYQDFKTIWEASFFAVEESNVDVNQAWEKFKERTEPKKTIWFRPWMAAASVIVALGLAWMYFSGKTTDKPPSFAYETSHQTQTFTLPDSSVVVLNKNSTLTFSSTKGTREVKLSGEAFFDVKPDKTKPFIIDVNQVQVRVLGTSFNIKGYNGDTEVLVETGLVKVAKGASDIQLKAREKVVIPAENLVLKKVIVNNDFYNFYRTGRLDFNNIKLREVVIVLNEAYGANIEIGSKAVAEIPINTVFENQSLENVLRVITETLPVRIEKQNQRIILK